MSLTKWLPKKSKPVRVGWYECRDSEIKQYDWWDGKRWCTSPTSIPYEDMYQDTMNWRGLTEKAK